MIVALKDLLVYLDPTDSSLGRLQLAVDLARRNRSSLTAVYVRTWSPVQLAHRKTAELAGRSLSDIGDLSHTVEGSIDRSALELKTAFEHLATQFGIENEWRMIDGEPRTVLPQHARYADLAILGSDTPGASTAAGYRFSEEMLFSAGRPVLLVPDSPGAATLGAHVAIAWNSSRSSARALNDALPLMECSEQVTVIAINPGDFIDLHGALPLPRLLAHLRRHGISAQLTEVSQVPAAEIGLALQEGARNAGADVMVAGAHGHTWLREVLLGSVTRDVLSQQRVALMMSH